MKRFTTDAGFGPTAQLMGHVALLPLARVGGYIGHDVSSLAKSARNITFGGLRVKGMLPFRGDIRAWIFAGFGYAGVHQGGGFFDVPFGVGASYTFFKPWQVLVELGGRAGFGHSGYPPAADLDRFALGLTVGVGIDL